MSVPECVSIGLLVFAVLSQSALDAIAVFVGLTALKY